MDPHVIASPGQKAPSAIRCIKTVNRTIGDMFVEGGQKAPSAIRCIKTRSYELPFSPSATESESTERHKVH